MYKQFTRRLLSVLLLLALVACAMQNVSSKPSRLDDPNMVDTVLVGRGHLGAHVSISQYGVDDHWGDYNKYINGWGNGGGTICCVKLPAKAPNKPYMVTVQWVTCDTRHIKYTNGRQADPNAKCITAQHQTTVPVHYAESKLNDVTVHFLPGDRVEIWSSNISSTASDYPGPAYPRGSAPDYVPVGDSTATTPPKGAKFFDEPDMSSADLSGVGHLGDKVEISNFYVTHKHGSQEGWNVRGWGGGGVTCCIYLPAKKPSTSYMVTVHWKFCDGRHIQFVNGESVDPNARCIFSEHEATVPVHYAFSGHKKDGRMLRIHFLPGQKVEAWYASHSDYPGPIYPEGPAPDYAPVLNEPIATQGGK